jgi:hypothetical protein
MLTQSELKLLVSYDPRTGIFTWLPRPPTTVGAKAFNARSAGKAAGTVSRKGYIHIRIGERVYLGHRLAWLYVHGHLPDLLIDHKDYDKANNRIDNLRLATKAQNNFSRKKSALAGVSFRSGRWYSKIRIAGKEVYLGAFDTSEAAKQAFDTAASAAYGEFFSPNQRASA